MLQALGNALLAQGLEVEFVDHRPAKVTSAKIFARKLRALARKLNLQVEVRRKAERVFIRTRYKPHGSGTPG